MIVCLIFVGCSILFGSWWIAEAIIQAKNKDIEIINEFGSKLLREIHGLNKEKVNGWSD